MKTGKLIMGAGARFVSFGFHSLAIGLGLAGAIASLQGQPVPPALSWVVLENGLEFRWPAASGAYLLEETRTMGGSDTWSPVLIAPRAAGLDFAVSLSTKTRSQFFRLRSAPLTTIQEISPANGEAGVAVTRETVLRFSNPLADDTVLGPEQLFAEFGGRRLLSRVELASDRRSATLFYLENLPGNARIRVTFQDDTLRDLFGRLVDADGDGQPGGTRVSDFDTLSLTPVVNTAIIGRVFASELLPGSTESESLNVPLAGVTITLDGMEQTVRTTTDAQGNFKLEPVPAGRFFVHVDGRTVTNVAAGIRYPDQAYYPFVGKAWEAIAGFDDNLAGGNGEIYLPLVVAGTLQAVSAISDATISFPPAVLRRNPELAGVSIKVPANGLLSENGTRGGQVGIAPVSPDRLPEPLPPDLDFPLVITIQTDGPANFDQPVPVRFPNLPDRETGLSLPPGAKSALWSFDHDTGNWEISGSMTVTADGQFVESDPGVGVRQPGWHATTPGSQGTGGNAREESCQDTGCSLGGISVFNGARAERIFSVASTHSRGIVNWFAPGASPQGGAGDTFTATFCSAGTHEVRAVLLSNCGQQRCEKVISVHIPRSEAPPQDPCTLLKPLILLSQPPFIAGADPQGAVAWEDPSPNPIGGTICYDFEGADQVSVDCAPGGMFVAAVWCRPGTYRIRRTLTMPCGTQCEMDDGTVTIEAPSSPPTCSITFTKKSAFSFVDTVEEFDADTHGRVGHVAWHLPGAVPEIDPLTFDTHFETFLNTVGPAIVTATFTDCTTGQQCTYALLFDVSPTPPAAPAPAVPRFQFNPPPASASPGPIVADVSRRRLGTRSRPVGLHGDPTDTTLRGLLYYALVNVQNQRIVRGIAGPDGVLHPRGIQVAPSTPYLEYVLDAATLNVGSAEFTSAPIGQSFEMPTVYVNAKEEADADGDSLSDLGELVMGTDPSQPDTDGDGVRDGAEVQSGGDPLSGIAVRTGVMAAAATPGPAVDVSAADDLAAVACKDYGLVLFNVFNGLDPVRIGQVETPGAALRVASAGSVAAVADGARGLAIIDLADPPAARIRHQVNLGAPVISVALGAGVVYAGTSRGVISLVDLATGSRLAETTLDGEIIDLFPLGDFVGVVTVSKLHVLAAAQGTLASVGSVDLANTERPRRLFGAESHLFVTHRNGVGAYEVAGGVPTFLQTLLTEPMPIPDIGWEHLVLNGSGVSLAAISQPPAPPTPGLRSYDLPAPAGPMTLIENLDHQGVARAVSIYNGMGYLAADSGGLQVVNYLPRDVGSQAPTLTLSASFPLEPAVVEEGQRVRISAQVDDDVQVRNVTFFLDGVAVATDGNYPFEYRFVTPLRTERSSFTLAAVATDTGGNVTRAAPITVTVTPDSTAPQIVAATPPDGAILATTRALTVFFNEPIVSASLTGTQWRLREAGPDTQPGTTDDLDVGGGILEHRPEILAALLRFPSDLPPGSYRAELLPGIRDLAGNVRGATHAWSFTLVGVATSAGPKLATGSGHTMIIEPDGSLWGWGNNFDGQIGDGGPQEDGRRPVRVGTANDWLTVAATRNATAAIKTDGSLWTWGTSGRNGAVLGQGDGVGSLDVPMRVGNATDWRFITGCDDQCYAIKADGSLWSWGENNDGVFGTDSEVGSSVPVRIGSDFDWFAVSTGDEEGTLGLKRDGSVWFWDGSPWTNTEVPTRIGTDNDWVAVAALRSEVATEDFSQVALKADGTLWYLGFVNQQYAFVQLGNAADWQGLAGGDSHLLALKTDGSLWAIGRNDAAQLGDGTLNEQLAFVRVALSGEVAAVATRFDHSVALMGDGTYRTWGENNNGQLGLGFTRTSQSTPLQVGNDTNWASVDFGQSSAVALKSDGTLWAWGQNFGGELGDGTKVGKTAPTQVGSEPNWSRVAAGNRHVVAVKQNGTLWGWGYNSSGQAGLDPVQAQEQLEPARIGADQDWVSVAAGYDHSLAIKADGSLWAWGGNDKGQLGDGTTQARFTPTRIGADADWQFVTTGGIPGRSSFALKIDGSLWAWGQNSAGFDFPNTDFLGVGDTTNRFAPTRIGTDNFWQAVAVGGSSKRLIQADGTLWTWRGILGGGAWFAQVDFVTGSVQFDDPDLLDPPSFIARLAQHTDPVSAFLWTLLDPASGFFPPESRQTLADPNASLADKLPIVVNVLNVAINQPLIYDAQRFAGITLSAETLALLAQSPTGESLRLLNRLLLEDAFPTELTRFALREWAAVEVGGNHLLGVRRDGSLWGEGSNYSGELGNGTVNDQSNFLQLVNSARNWTRVDAGQNVSAGIRTDGTLWTWGDYEWGLLGQPVLLMPRAIGNSANWTASEP